MADKRELTVNLHLNGAGELKPGGIYLIQAPCEMPADVVAEIGKQMEYLSQQMGVKFVILSSQFNPIKPTDLALMPEFQEAVLTTVRAEIQRMKEE